ncbi:4-carboxy-4-hydroxy-2-oxoadipate aldolase/oxaloacetate decarboxylase [Actinoplanes siamensis]|uniref:4-carboxy-4-hydroxy-2-oxoadipate aldolase/oxaloacetate decarboxylase n=1 Tax=Actinoplanes siamensis TaxID=1223317 RepID=UPI001EF34913|nr:4-carboxy-4-hydroxy-2-oxoadipate aldolase/oxaloacetate decarboxylase [Actinoplanes siamensis]
MTAGEADVADVTDIVNNCEGKIGHDLDLSVILLTKLLAIGLLTIHIGADPMASHYVVRCVDRAAPETVVALRDAGVATAHEAAGRTGLLGPAVQARQNGITIAGSAITVSCHPGDNLMIHAAVEVCRPGDVLVVTTTSPSTDGMFGDLLATSLQARGVAGLIIDAGVRDIATLREMAFPVWSRAIHAQATVKASPGSVNVPVVADGQIVRPGDIVVADDDGVLAVPAARGPEIAAAAAQRLAAETGKREQLAAGTLGVDLYRLRPLLASLGVQYVDRLPS